MNTIRKLSALVAGALGLLLVGLALAPVAAARPLMFRDVLEEIVDIDCGDYTLREDRTLHFLVLAFFDEEGDLATLQIHIHGTVIRTNLDTMKSSEERPAVSVFVDFEEGTFTVVGAVFNVIIEGEGIVIQGTGRVVFSETGGLIFEAGPHDVLDDPGIVCDHLR